MRIISLAKRSFELEKFRGPGYLSGRGTALDGAEMGGSAGQGTGYMISAVPEPESGVGRRRISPGTVSDSVTPAQRRNNLHYTERRSVLSMADWTLNIASREQEQESEEALGPR